MFKDTPEGKTHSYGDGCGEPEHNQNRCCILCYYDILEDGVVFIAFDKCKDCPCHQGAGSNMEKEKEGRPKKVSARLSS